MVVSICSTTLYYRYQRVVHHNFLGPPRQLLLWFPILPFSSCLSWELCFCFTAISQFMVCANDQIHYCSRVVFHLLAHYVNHLIIIVVHNCLKALNIYRIVITYILSNMCVIWGLCSTYIIFHSTYVYFQVIHLSFDGCATIFIYLIITRWVNGTPTSEVTPVTIW